jgi:hypothetical protein
VARVDLESSGEDMDDLIQRFSDLWYPHLMDLALYFVPNFRRFLGAKGRDTILLVGWVGFIAVCL